MQPVFTLTTCCKQLENGAHGSQMTRLGIFIPLFGQCLFQSVQSAILWSATISHTTEVYRIAYNNFDSCIITLFISMNVIKHFINILNFY